MDESLRVKFYKLDGVLFAPQDALSWVCRAKMVDATSWGDAGIALMPIGWDITATLKSGVVLRGYVPCAPPMALPSPGGLAVLATEDAGGDGWDEDSDEYADWLNSEANC